MLIPPCPGCLTRPYHFVRLCDWDVLLYYEKCSPITSSFPFQSVFYLFHQYIIYVWCFWERWCCLIVHIRRFNEMSIIHLVSLLLIKSRNVIIWNHFKTCIYFRFSINFINIKRTRYWHVFVLNRLKMIRITIFLFALPPKLQ